MDKDNCAIGSSNKQCDTNTLYDLTSNESRLSCFLLGLLVMFAHGCALGPKWIRTDWRAYNDSLVDVESKDLLLNIVRLRYNDYPGTLKIGSVTSQRNWSVNGNLGGIVPEGGPDSLSAGLGGLRSERPTVSFLPGGQDVIKSVLTPLSIESLYLASYLGWPTSTSWRFLMKSINGVANAPQSGHPMPTDPPEFAEFFELAINLRELHLQGLIEVGRIEKITTLNDGIPAATLTAEESRVAAEAGYMYQPSYQQGQVVLSRKKQISVLRFAESAIGTPEHSRVVEILELDPSGTVFELEPAFEGTLQSSMKPKSTIEIGMRSLLEILFLASKGVQVPGNHLKCNLAPSNDVDADWHLILGGFQVRVCDEEPDCAAVSVKYRDCWFYIDARDQDSKKVFFLIKLIYDAQVQGGGAENLPLLTLPL